MTCKVFAIYGTCFPTLPNVKLLWKPKIIRLLIVNEEKINSFKKGSNLYC